ncbi:helix-turn-helix domain-containing protein [Saccharopolyspora rosea]|uniref:Helix-turn-helix domain-containing protein n=1 Tax=Saccharopolyspora rosea TaxID=524884 RepID=A0ABW3G4P6_9PSEU|nr:helix-turn-helix transcriptional regulator [Saccharopolyspora rosea]
MPRKPGGSPKARNLGAELRKVRDEAGINQRALAQKMEIARPRLQRWENGTTVPSVEDVAIYLAMCGLAKGPERERLLDLARDVDAENWITSDLPGTHSSLTTFIEFERTCTSMVNVAPLLIPGLLQTADYSRAVMAGLGSGEIEKRVMLRLGRQNILWRRRNPLRFTAVIVESALRERVGGPHVMADQLYNILDVAKRDNVSVHVIRSGGQRVHAAHAGPFIVFRFPKAPPIVHIEHYRSSVFLYNTREVADYVRAEEDLRSMALSREDSLELVADIAAEMEKEADA